MNKHDTEPFSQHVHHNNGIGWFKEAFSITLRNIHKQLLPHKFYTGI